MCKKSLLWFSCVLKGAVLGAFPVAVNMLSAAQRTSDEHKSAGAHLPAPQHTQSFRKPAPFVGVEEQHVQEETVYAGYGKRGKEK